MKKKAYTTIAIASIVLVGCTSKTMPEPPVQVVESEPPVIESIPFERIQKTVQNPRIEVFANNETIFYTVPAYIAEYMGQTTAVAPLYPTAKAMGWDVEEAEGVFTLQDKGEVVRFKLNQRVFLHNGETVRTEVPFQTKEEEIFIPVRPIALALGDHVEWSEKRYHLKMETPPIVPVDIPILVYHDLAYNRYDTLAVDPVRFQEQMTLLKEQGYTTITERDLLLYLQGEKNLPTKPILIHFDDGYENTYHHAYPVLKELGMKATYYLVGATVKAKTADHEPYPTPHLSWEQIQEMHESGVISFESHTFDLHGNGVSVQYKGETDTLYQQRLLDDFIQSKKLIEDKLGTTVLALAYPFGDYNDTADEMAKKAGYGLTMTMDEGKVTLGDSPYKLKRIYVSGADHGEAFLKSFTVFDEE